MFATIISLCRTEAQSALPVGLFTPDRILHDAVELPPAITTAPARVVSISVELNAADAVTMGSRPRHSTDGFIDITWYEPSGSGDGDQLTHLSTMAQALNQRRLTDSDSDVVVNLHSPVVINAARSGPYWVRTLRVPLKAGFYYS